MNASSSMRAAMFAAFMTLAACEAGAPFMLGGNNSSGQNGSDVANGNLPFSPLSLDAQVNKVKLLMTSDAVTAADLETAKKSGIAASVAAWQQTPSYQAKILTFLSTALQQSASLAADFEDQGVKIDNNAIGNNSPLLISNLRESMARTVLAADAAGQPFSTSMTTHTFQMTTPMVAYYAFLDATQVDDNGKTTSTVGDANFKAVMAAFNANDFASWRAVTIRTPNAGEATTSAAATNFGSLTEMVLKTPRQGFMTTPSFFAVWQTNDANLARVTMNQALIVALGAVFDGTNVSQPLSTAALDTKHAAPGTACYGCHINLDPMRQIYRQFYSIHFGAQTNATQTAMQGQFAWGGVSKATSTPDDFGNILASHPAMPMAWAQKVCTWANNAPCVTDDPELVRLASAFAADGSFSKLVAGVMSSPLTTYASVTKTTQQSGVTFSVDKQDHLCPLLSQRLGIADVCGLAPGASPTGPMATVQLIANILPANSFSRGQVAPPQANDPTLFFRSGAENVCAALAAQVVDGAVNKSFPSTDVTTATANMVHVLMGIPAGSGRDTQVIAILTEHYQKAVATGASAANAMQSTFVAACLSPSVMGIGQ